MNVCLIRPALVKKINSFSVNSSPPLGLAYIAAVLRNNGHNVTVIDAATEKPMQARRISKDIVVTGLSNEETLSLIPKNTDLIGINCMFSNNWISDRVLIDEICELKTSCKVVLGGEHASAAAEFCHKQCKYLFACVLGEGEETIVELAEAIEKQTDYSNVNGIVYKDASGNICRNAPRTRIRSLDLIPMPAWDLFPVSKYLEHKMYFGVDRGNCLPLLASRGCPYECTFCSSPQMWGTKYGLRQVDNIISEMIYLKNKYDIINFDFFDLTAIINKRWIIELCQQMVHNNLNVTWQLPSGTRSEAIDGEVINWLYKAGCRNITYAPESGSKRMLDIIQKKVSLDRMLNSIKEAVKTGMKVKINIVMGFPQENHLDVWYTLWFILKCSWLGVHDTKPNIYYPYPGSELFEKLEKEGKISLESDEFYLKLIHADSIFMVSSYNTAMGTNWIRFYILAGFLIFYISNYLFRPFRFFKSVYNILNNKVELKLENGMKQFLKRKKYQFYNT